MRLENVMNMMPNDIKDNDDNVDCPIALFEKNVPNSFNTCYYYPETKKHIFLKDQH